MSSNIMNKIRFLDFCTRRFLGSCTNGSTRSKRRGFGFEFDTLDDYQEGDDIRYIDYLRSSGREKLIMRRYQEEQSRRIMLMVDVSGSTLYGSHHALIHTLHTEIGTVLSLAAAYHKDSLGMITFAETVKEYIPQRRGHAGALACSELLLTSKPHGMTDLLKTATYGMTCLRQRSLVILISDTIDEHYQQAWRMLNSRHELVILRCVDPYTQLIPKVPFFSFQDSETGQTVEQNFSLSSSRIVHEWHKEQEKYAKSLGIDMLTVSTGSDWLASVLTFFECRRLYS